MSKTSLRGQTILEVLLAVMLITITFVGLYALSSSSIKQTSYSRNLSLASTYSSEASDWLYDAKRVYGYQALAAKFDGDSGAATTVTYCLDLLPATSELFEAMVPASCTSADRIADTIYLRSMTIDLSELALNTIHATITTTWEDNTAPASAQTITIGQTR